MSFADDPLTLYEPVLPPEPSTFAKRPAGWGELFEAGRTVAELDNSNARDQRLERAYAPVLDAINDYRRSERLPAMTNPVHGVRTLGPGAAARFGSAQGLAAAANVGQDAAQSDIFSEIARIRRARPDFLKGLPDSPAKLVAAEAAKDRARRGRALATLDRGEGVRGWATGFAGGVAGAMTDPVNILTMPIGGGGKTVVGAAAREALANGVMEVLTTPITARNRGDLGETLSVGEAIENVGMAAVGGGLLGGAIKGVELGAPRAGEAIGNSYDALIARAYEAMPEPLKARWESWAEIPDTALPEVARTIIGADRLTPDERAAVNVLTRQSEIVGTMPWPSSRAASEAHEDALSAAIARIVSEAPQPDRRAIIRSLGTETALARGNIAVPRETPATIGPQTAPIGGFMARVRGAESGGNDLAAASGSSAYGRYQFTKGTWLAYYRRRFGDTGESDAAILAKRADGEMQDRLMRDLTTDNATRLRAAGQAETEGNLYLAHFAGPKGAVALLRAAPDTPVARVLTADAIRANRAVLEGKTAGDVVAWAHRKMGERTPARAEAGPAAETVGLDDGAALRAEADRLTEQLVAPGVPRGVSRETVEPIAPATPIDAPIDVEFDRVVLAPERLAAIDRAAAEAEQERSLVAPLVDRARDRSQSLHPAAIAAQYDISEDMARRALALAAGVDGSGLTVTRSGKVLRAPRQTGPIDAITFLARNGGLRNTEGHDLLGTIGQRMVPGAGPLVRRETGLSVDEAGGLLWEAGYFHDRAVESETGPTRRPSEDEVLDFLEAALTRKRYPLDQLGDAIENDELARQAEATAAARQAAEDELGALLIAGDLELDAGELDEAVTLMVERGYSAGDAMIETVNRAWDDALDAAAIDADTMDYAPGEWYGGDDGRPANLADAADDRRSPGDAGDAGEGRAGAEEYARADADADWRGSADAVDPEAWSAWDDPAGPVAKAQAEDLSHDAEAALDAAGGYRLDSEGAPRSLADILKEADAEDAAIAAARACLKPGGGA